MTVAQDLLPRPRHLELRWGRLELDRGLRLHSAEPEGRASAALQALIERFQGRFDRLLGMVPQPGAARCLLRAGPAGPRPLLDDAEDYTLRITDAGAELSAATPWGAAHGLERCLQLLERDLAGRYLPALVIEDGPRLPWRGLLLDIARHHLGLPALLRTLDGMAAAGLNVLHLHLNDDQGFRFESPSCPRLQQLSGRGGYLRQQEVATLVDAAAERGIRVVPELDLPGHAGAILHAYPELAAGPAPTELPRAFGPSRYALDPSLDATWELLDALLDDLLAVFPDPFVHLGGDEVHPEVYAFSDPRRQAWMAAEGLANGADVQAWFTRKLVAGLRSRGRHCVGWDEVLHPAMPAGITIQSWRGAGSLEAALAAGHDALFSSGWYLDLNYPARWHYRFDPALPSEQLLAEERALAAEPVLADVADGVRALQDAARATAEQIEPAASRGRVLGGEACLWAELLTAEVLDVRLHGRLAAVAERLWSAADSSDADDFERRLPGWLAHLERVTPCRPLTGHLPTLWALGVTPTERWAVETLLEALAPVRWYKRLLGAAGTEARLSGGVPERPYDADTPLQRPVDLLPPDSMAMFELRRALKTLKAGPGKALAEITLRDFAGRWRMLPVQLAGLMGRSAPFAALEPRIEQLQEVADLLDTWIDAIVASDPPGLVLRQRFGEWARWARPAVAETELAVIDVLAPWLGPEA